MPEYLNEHYVSVAQELIFPNVQTCCALIVTTTMNNNLGGYHLTYYSNKREVDRALLYLSDAMGGNIDGVYLIGNVLQRAHIAEAGLAYAAPLRGTLRDGLGYAFPIRYYDIGLNNNGVAVRAWRDPGNNGLRLSVSDHGNWALGAAVPAGGTTLVIGESMAASMDGNPGTKLRIYRPPGGNVVSCQINAATAIVPFNMESF